MNISEVLASIDSEIATLQQARALLAGQDGQASSVIKPTGKRTMTAAGRAKIAAAQRKRWAKVKRAAKKG